MKDAFDSYEMEVSGPVSLFDDKGKPPSPLVTDKERRISPNAIWRRERVQQIQAEMPEGVTARSSVKFQENEAERLKQEDLKKKFRLQELRDHFKHINNASSLSLETLERWFRQEEGTDRKSPAVKATGLVEGTPVNVQMISSVFLDKDKRFQVFVVKNNLGEIQHRQIMLYDKPVCKNKKLELGTQLRKIIFDGSQKDAIERGKLEKENLLQSEQTNRVVS